MKRLFKIQFLLMLLLSTMIFANIGGGIAPTVAPTISVNETLTLTPQYGDTQKYAYYKFTVANDTEATISYTAPSEERIYFVLHKTNPHKQLITKLTDEGSTKNVQATLSAGEYYFLIKKYGASTQGIPLSISLDDGGEPEPTQTWRIYDATPAGASITTVNDAQKGTVVKLSGDGTQNGYVLGGWENSTEALNSTKKSIRWSMKYNENFTIFVRVMTKNGGRYLMYSNTPYDYAIDNAYVHKGLGKSVANGTWQTIERDLEADLQTNEPNNSITAINGFYVRGSGLFDTVELGNDTVTPPIDDTIPPVITLKGANPVNLKVGDSYTEAGATATDDVDGNISADIIIDSSAVDTSKVGKYTIKYTVYDDAGNKATKSREVVVNDILDVLLKRWYNKSIKEQTGSVEVTFIATPSAENIDSVMGLSNTQADAYTDLGIIVRFSPSGNIDARNGDSYNATTSIHYEANKVYTFRLIIDFNTKKYSIYVTAEGEDEVLIGENYNFRTEQSSLSSITSMAHYSKKNGVVRVGEVTFKEVTITPPINAIKLSPKPLLKQLSTHQLPTCFFFLFK